MWYPIEIRHTPTEAEEQQVYDTIYTEQGIRQRDSLYLWFLDQAARYGRGRLLDVSCGEGWLVTLAQHMGFDAVGIDISLAGLQKFQSGDTHTRVFQANAQQLPFADNSFDAITNMGSLEHYFDPAEGVREMARVLHPDGVALVLVPNTFGLFGNVAHVMLYGEIYDDGQPLQRYASRGSWERLLAANGLRTEQVISCEYERPRTLHDLGLLLRQPAKMVRFLTGPLVPVNLSHILVFVCRKSKNPT
jgi:SAM-dependent methyltransferase